MIEAKTHPIVASVFHLGSTGENYFYAMEFVEGETLENLIRRSGRLDVLLAEDLPVESLMVCAKSLVGSLCRRPRRT
jgi:hypothetical protein